MDISVEHVQLVFPLKQGVEGVKVLQPVESLKNSRNLALRNKKDTVADIQKMVVDVQLLPLFSNQVMVDELNFEDEGEHHKLYPRSPKQGRCGQIAADGAWYRSG